MKTRIAGILLVVTLCVSSVFVAQAQAQAQTAGDIWRSCKNHGKVDMEFHSGKGMVTVTRSKRCYPVCAVFLDNDHYKRYMNTVSSHQYIAAGFYKDMGVSLNSNYDKYTILITGMIDSDCEHLHGKLNNDEFTLPFWAVMKSPKRFYPTLKPPHGKGTYEHGCATQNLLPAGLVLVNKHEGEFTRYTLFTNTNNCKLAYKLIMKKFGKPFTPRDDTSFKRVQEYPIRKGKKTD